MKSQAGTVGRDRLLEIWESGGPARRILEPLSWGFRMAVAARRRAFGAGVFSSRRASVPVVSVGNLTVGGTGKTPATIWLAGRLQEQGHTVAIVSRGYSGRLGTRTAVVGRGGRALLEVDEIGDEAMLLATRFEGPVVCGADRVAAVEIAVSQEGATVVVLDDGFQHWRLQRDFDIVLVDGRTGFGNGSLLPAGPLREPLGALSRAAAIIVTKATPDADLQARLRRHAPEVPVFQADLVPVGLSEFEGGSLRSRPLGDLVGRRVVTVSALAEPRSFYDLLGELEVQPVEVLEYPDHHRFSQSDWHHITQAAHRADLVVCTEKDLVKLGRFPFARGRLAALRVDFSPKSTGEQDLLSLIGPRLRREGERVSDKSEVGWVR